MSITNLSEQLSDQRRKVDFNTYDMSVKELISMVNEGEINIAPDYQRQFRWDEERQSKLVESIFLGIPVPSLFMATNADNTWEVIDGVQRLSTIINFAADIDSKARASIGHVEALKLINLNKLSSFNNCTYNDLPSNVQLDFRLKPLKVITLSDKSDRQVRFDLFERLNTGGVKLSDQEIRSCVYRGAFNDLIKKLATDSNFLQITKKPEKAFCDGTMEELVLRFFAYFYDRSSFSHDVKNFLNEYMGKNDNKNLLDMELMFRRVCQILSELPYGVVKVANRKNTSTVMWEAVTVGLADALTTGKTQFRLDDFYEWVNEPEFVRYVTGATNSANMLNNRINYARNMFMR